ncbi:MAG: 23S rRNA (pseudouridine(1915)-N(3))-methyltransferase RlmH [Marinibacterium sp.]|nr:23S rRNA (pseudouridine(1915)-N(3))-methyltransferase RlmH [Marinibacterium sp.]
MRVHICAVGRLRAGPEKTLIDDYLKRFDRTGRALGLGPASVLEVDERKAQTSAAQCVALERVLPRNAILCCMDERGRMLKSPDFANILRDWTDLGHSDVAFLIGGADGLEPGLRDRAQLSLSFGAMVWPHMLARVMLAEQLYRATTILAGTPYHRA